MLQRFCCNVANAMQRYRLFSELPNFFRKFTTCAGGMIGNMIGKQSFYERNGFRLLQNEIPTDSDTVLMYFDLKYFDE